MFSALKRWTKMGGEESKLSMPSGVKAMGQALQRKFARGVQYNMKIIIKGDRNTGKTCMFHRLQGKPFNEQYIPTNEIQAGSIHWTYKAADDIVKVDVWDVVDVGKSRKPSDSLKIENNPSTENGEDNVVADANFLDVYKGTHGVIMVMDITKPWTFQYIRRELPKVPAHIPVLVLGSHRDMEEHRLIDPEEVTSFIQNLERPDRSPPIHYAESSMKNGFGLKYIHTFLNFPFLLLQREALLQQLQVNAMDMESTLEELQLYKQTEEQDYYKYIDFMEEKQKEQEKKLKAEAEARRAAENEAKASNENVSSASPPQTNKAVSRKDSQSGGLRKWFSSSKPHIPNDEVIPKQQPTSNAAAAPSNIEEFKPEDELDAGFLDEDSSTKEKSKVKNRPKKNKSVEVDETPSGSSDESDSDSGPVNPMVASFAEDISDDETVTVTNGNIQSEDTSKELDVKPRPAVEDVHITSSEEEEEEEEEKIEVLKPKVLQPAPVATPKGKTHAQENSLKLKVRDSSSETSIVQREKKQNSNDIDDWLDSPDIEPQISFGTSKEEDYTVTKVDINNPSSTSPPAPSITVDEWSLFMSEQMKMNEKKSKKPSIDEDEEPANESKHHKKKEHKSGEKSRSKKHKKHKEKDEENEGEKEHRRSKHKDADKEKRKSEDSEKKKKSKHKHSKKKSIDSSEHQEGVTYEEL